MLVSSAPAGLWLRPGARLQHRPSRAEGEGFEPSVRLDDAQRFSRPSSIGLVEPIRGRVRHSLRHLPIRSFEATLTEDAASLADSCRLAIGGPDAALMMRDDL